MFAKFRNGIVAGAVSVCALMSPVWAATVTVLSDAPQGGMAIALQTDDFQRIGNCGGGFSVVGDGCSVVKKYDPTAEDAYGRFDPPDNYWIDSQDIDELAWTVTAPTAFTSMSFALTDAHDQQNSFFSMFYDDGDGWSEIFSIPDRLANGNLFWLTVDFGEAVEFARFLFKTKVGNGYDGFGISELTVAPVPLPPAAALLASGAALLAGLRRRRRAQ